VVGGLLLSQTLTLFTTPVIYLAFESLSRKYQAWRRRPRAATGQPTVPAGVQSVS